MCLLLCSETCRRALAPGEDLFVMVGARANPVISSSYVFTKNMQKQLLEQKVGFLNDEN